jgi:hypothetical protein
MIRTPYTLSVSLPLLFTWRYFGDFPRKAYLH